MLAPPKGLVSVVKPGPLVVLVHGLWMTGVELWGFARRLHRAGYRTHIYHYHSVTDGLADNAARLARFLAQQPPGTHLVGHSLGGLIAARALSDHPTETAEIRRFVAVGAPLRGCGSARTGARLPLIGTRLVGRGFPLADAQNPRAFFQRWIDPHPLGIIAGTLPFGMGQWVGAVPLPNDGLVALEETRLPGATAYAQFRVSHIGLTFSRRVAAQTAHFLAHGEFVPAGVSPDHALEYSRDSA